VKPAPHPPNLSKMGRVYLIYRLGVLNPGLNNPWCWEKDDLYPNNLSEWNESSSLVFESHGKSYTQVIVL
jgi:hypothetical protein